MFVGCATVREHPADRPAVGQPTATAGRYTHDAVTPGLAVITFVFDPYVSVAGRSLRLETLALAVAILAGIILAARIAGRTPASHLEPSWRLRRDDLLFIALGIVPGAVVGGRVGYALLHTAYYGVHPGDLLDPAQGALELGLAVVGGVVTGSYVARLLDAPVGRWLHAATLPVLMTIGLGKVAQALGGSGQGAPSDASWATAYVGPGPWGSIAPAIAAYPSQLLEAAATGAVLLVVVLLLAAGRLRTPDGRTFFVALGLWALVRAIVATTWRDETVAGGLRAGQWIALAIAIASVGIVAVILRAAGRADRIEAERAGLRWPDREQPPAV